MKQKIINSSISLFGQKGFSETSIQDIVDSLGVTKGTFYYYFKSKQELLNDIHLSFIEDILHHQQNILSDQTKNYKTKLHDIIHVLIKNIRIQGQSARIFFREMKNLNEEHLAPVKQKRDQFRFGLQEVIEKGMEAGEFRSTLQPDLVAFTILGVINWSYYWYNPNGVVNEDDLTAVYDEVILNGILRH